MSMKNIQLDDDIKVFYDRLGNIRLRGESNGTPYEIVMSEEEAKNLVDDIKWQIAEGKS